MKNLNIGINAFMFFFLSASICSAQYTFLSLGGEVGFPGNGLSYDSEKMVGTGFGISGRYEGSWGNHFSGIATLGYVWFNPRDSDILPMTTKLTVIPIQIGVKYYPFKKNLFGLFISTELGIMVAMRESIYPNQDLNRKRTFKDASIAPGIGYLYKNLETGLRLQYNLSDAGFNVYYYNFRIAYSILKKKASPQS